MRSHSLFSTPRSDLGEVNCGYLAHEEADGSCVCDEGHVWDSSGQCTPKFNPPYKPAMPGQCEEGYHFGGDSLCWVDGDPHEADYTKYVTEPKPFSIFDPGTWFSTMTTTGELSPPVFVPEGATPPVNGIIVSPPAVERPFQGQAPAPGQRPLPGQGEPAGADAEGTTIGGEKEKTSPWIWIGGAAVLGIAGWMLFGKSGSKTG